jgi:hypothetical protein
MIGDTDAGSPRQRFLVGGIVKLYPACVDGSEDQWQASTRAGIGG